MAFLDTLKSLLSAPGEEGRLPASGDTDTVRRIMRKLEELEPGRARWIAAFAYILGRVANADLDISAEETAKMEEIVQQIGELPEEQAVLVVGIAKSQNRLVGQTENFLVTREFNEISTRKEREKLLDCLFAVSAADDSISGAEETQIRQIASELAFSHREYVDARSVWSDKREVLKGLRGKRTT
jgi:uncharacterized tellurite resistance protein B-like protein